MKLLVGTLRTIENEFDACCASIEAQSYREFDHVVIRDLPNQEAHEALYGNFMRRSDEYDLLVKVDADMVLTDPETFRKIVARFEDDPELDLLLIAVKDYFADGLLMGVNVFRNTVKWRTGEALFTDMTYVESTIRKTEKDYTDLGGSVLHCANPSPWQAFHYGFHHGMKAVQGGQRWEHVRKLVAHYGRNPDLRLAYGILGASAAFDPRFIVEHISYNDQTLLRYFEDRYGRLTEDEIHRAARRSKARWVGWLLDWSLGKSVVARYYRLRETRRGRPGSRDGNQGTSPSPTPKRPNPAEAAIS